MSVRCDVFAAAGWTDTGLVLPAGWGLRTWATGEVTFAGGDWYAYPEGAYPPHNIYPPTGRSTYDVTGVYLPGSSLQLTDGVVFSLSLYVQADGVSAPSSAGLLSGCLQCNRRAEFGASAINGGDGGRVWAAFNDLVGYFGDNAGSFALYLTPVDPLAPEVDIRVYNAEGTRKAVPQNWIDTLQFEIAEKGGMQTGSLQALATWEELQLLGTEYVDVRLWGELLYRGYVRQPQNEIAAPSERASPTLHGPQIFLNHTLCRRDLHYLPAKNLADVFGDVCALWVNKAGRHPFQVDAEAVRFLGIRVSHFPAKGKTAAQALNALCDLAPSAVVWGCDVDPLTNVDRLYLRPRADLVRGAEYAIGGQVGAFVYPRDATKVVNTLHVTGGALDGTNNTDSSQANLLPNGSFEDSAGVGEFSANVLQNSSFEDDFDWWQWSGAAHAMDFGRTGSGAAELNNDDVVPEKIWQDIPVAYGLTSIHASGYWNSRQPSTVWTNQVKLELFTGGTWTGGNYSGGALVADSTQTPQAGIADPIGYTYHRYAYDWTLPATTDYDCLRVSYILVSENQTGYAGQVLLDDCAVWFDQSNNGGNAAKSWRVGRGVGGAWSATDWQATDMAAYDGDVSFKGTAVIRAGSGHYAEICTTLADRPQGHPRRAYLLAFRVYNPGVTGVACQAGARIYESGKLKATRLGSTVTVLNDWYPVLCDFGSGTACDAIEPFLRVTGPVGNQTIYVDAAGLYIDTQTPPTYYTPDNTFRAVVNTNQFTSSDIGADAAGSIAMWGVCEGEANNDNVVDNATLMAFAQGYFKTHAVPTVQARLTVRGPTSPLQEKGLVGLLNLPLPPPPLPVARVRYQVGAEITIEADLSSERPELANLLRLVSVGKA